MDQRQYVNVESESSFFSKVYGLMALGVGISAAVAILLTTVFSYFTTTIIYGHPLVVTGITIAELIMVISIRFKADRSPSVSLGLFLIYAILNGVTFTMIFAIYNLGSIISAFTAATAMFIGLSIYGRVTKANLSTMGKYAFMGLLGVIVATIVNIFLKSSGLNYLLSYATLIIFIVFTAWDNQKLKMMYQKYGVTGQMSIGGLAVMGALELYLDFVNLFISLLNIMNRD